MDLEEVMLSKRWINARKNPRKNPKNRGFGGALHSKYLLS